MTPPRNPPIRLSERERDVAGPAANAVLAFRLVGFLGERLRRRLDERLAEDGLTTRQGFLMTVVRTRGRPTLGEVASAMSTTHQNARQIASALERKGMLRISVDAADSRVRRLEIAPGGLAGWERRDDGDYAAIGGWFSALSLEEQATLAGLLSRLAESMR